MLTALIPIQISDNTFWSSGQGIDLIDSFLAMIKEITLIDRSYISSNDSMILPLAEKYGIEVLQNPLEEKLKSQYRYKQIISIGQNYIATIKPTPDKQCSIIVVDHRNINTNTATIAKAINKFNENPESPLISVSLCKDYPCQYVAFYQFIGSEIIYCKTSRNLKNINVDLSDNKDQLIVCLSRTDSGFDLSFAKNKLTTPPSGYNVRVIPFDSNGIQYNQASELFINKQQSSFFLNICPQKTEGIILNLFMPSQTGEYDTKEIFTPKCAPWELSLEEDTLIDSNTLEPIFGRQQFIDTYSYNAIITIFDQILLKCQKKVPFRKIILSNINLINNHINYLDYITH